MRTLFKSIVRTIVTAEARLVLKKYNPKIIIVTGSVGKTSTKDAVYAALAKRFFVRKSEKSYNSDIGVPLTILGLPNGWSNPFVWLKNFIEGAALLFMKAPYPEFLIIEVGADRPGDISRALSWLSPAVVVATRFPAISVHVEFYENPREVIAEELAPARWLGESGILIVNGDDPEAHEAWVNPGVRKVTFGFGAGSEVRGSGFRITSEDKQATGIAFDISYAGQEERVAIPGVVGRTHAYAALAGIAVAVRLGATLTEAAAAVGAYEPPPSRLRLVAGINGTTLVDDTYNSSPAAAEEALEALAAAPRRGRRIAVLADMLELGSFSAAEHKRIGELARASSDILITVGVRARSMGAEPTFDRGADAATYLKSMLQSGDVVLIKGSQSMRMEKVVKALMQDPEGAKKLLCRQDEEWLKK